MIPRVLIAVALAVAWLSGKHVTVWIAGCPAATIPVLALVALFAVAVCAGLAVLVWRMHNHFSGPLVWKTT